MNFRSSWVMAGLLAALLYSAPRAPGQSTWYVATSGADVGNSGASWTEPVLTISNAIAKAGAGDVVLVSNGTYLVAEPIAFGDLTVQSLNGPFLTAIDGGQAVRCVTMTHSNARLRDFTIQNGLADNGGGIYLSSGGLISNCRITDNVSVSTNDKYYDGGGGISAGGVCYVEDCWIYGNSASNGGGGIRCRNGVLEVNNTTIAGNAVSNGTYSGAGISCYSASGATLRMFDCLVADNRTEKTGGGVCWYYGAIEIDRCRFIGNYARNGAGGFLGYAAQTSLRNTLFANNTTWGGNTGGGMLWQGGASTTIAIENCTVVSNSAGSGSGGGIALSTSGTGSVVNSIIYFNKGGAIKSNWFSSVSCTFSNCCTAPIDTLSGADNMDANPELVDWQGGNYRLLPASPCLNAGLYAEWMEGELDLDGYTRIDRFFRRVDIGAYEDTRQGALFNVR